MPRVFSGLLIWLMVALGPTHSASADVSAADRVALIIGNNAYRHVTPLVNPGNDAADVARALRGLGFDVIEARDLDHGGMRRSLAEFAARLEGADVGLFFYAGHAMQVAGNNYLAPVDARLERGSDVYVELITMGDVLRIMEEEVPTRLVFLDSCRDNPLTRRLSRTRGGGRQGLAPVQAAVGTLIAYSTAPNSLAQDGEGENSPFTEALLEHIETPGMEVRQVLSRVRENVIDRTGGRQVPWDSSSLTGDFFFRLEVNGRVPVIAGSPLEAERALDLSDDDLGVVHAALAALGHPTGSSEGRLGATARRSISRFQSRSGLEPSGFLDVATYSALLVAADPILLRHEELISGVAFERIDVRDLLAGDEEAVRELFEGLETLIGLVETDEDMPRKVKLAADGDGARAEDLGWAFQSGDGVPRMSRLAARMFAYSASLGDPSGTNGLAWVLSRGHGVTPDHALAVELYRRAAAAGIREAYNGLGDYYEEGGGGLPKDLTKAAENFKKGAELGYWWSKLNYARLLEKGAGVAQDHQAALTLYQEVLDQELPEWVSADVRLRAEEGRQRLDR